jgi:glucose 1-dehydrogenase
MRLDGKAAIVTGAARGIGRAIAKAYLAAGARVMIADVEDKLAAKTVGELSALGEVRFLSCDVGERLDVHNLVAETVDAFGDVDVLVNNAGIVHAADFLALDEADFDRVLRVNLKGAFLVGQAVARQMVEQVKAGRKPGAIVNMSSVNAELAIPNQVPYCVSKGGLAQLTNVMALALAPHGIRVNAIGPGSIMTEMLAGIATDKAAKTRILSRTPLQRFGDPSEIAEIAVFLASDASSYVTGQTIFADGGRLGLNYTVPVPEAAV